MRLSAFDTDDHRDCKSNGKKKKEFSTIAEHTRISSSQFTPKRPLYPLYCGGHIRARHWHFGLCKAKSKFHSIINQHVTYAWRLFFDCTVTVRVSQILDKSHFQFDCTVVQTYTKRFTNILSKLQNELVRTDCKYAANFIEYDLYDIYQSTRTQPVFPPPHSHIHRFNCTYLYKKIISFILYYK